MNCRPCPRASHWQSRERLLQAGRQGRIETKVGALNMRQERQRTRIQDRHTLAGLHESPGGRDAGASPPTMTASNGRLCEPVATAASGVVSLLPIASIRREWLLLELRNAVEADDGAHDHVADFEFLADAARGPGGDHQLGSHFLDDLTPHIDVR